MRLGWAVFFVLWVSVGWADVTVELYADRTQISMEEGILVTVLVSGARSASEPQFKALGPFEIQSRGSSSKVQIVNTQITAQVEYQYGLYPKKSGTFTIGPVEVTHKGKNYQSNAIKVSVTDTQTSQAPGAAPGGQLAKGYHLEAIVENTKPYVNQQVDYVFRFMTRVDVAGADLQMPEFDGFWVEDLGKQRRYTKVIEGQRWEVTEIRKALFPLKSGRIELLPTTLIANVVVPTPRNRRRVDPFDQLFFGSRQQTKRVRLASQPIVFNVRSFPSGGKPKNFSGAVGEFRATASLGGQTTLKVGESATLTVTVEGVGNVRDIEIAAPQPAQEEFKIYEDAPQQTLSKANNQIQGTKVFKWAIVPLKEGQLKITLPPLSYFDPNRQRYVASAIEIPNIDVMPGTAETFTHLQTPQFGTNKKSIKLEGEDLRPIQRSPASLRADAITLKQKMAVLVLFFLLPFLYAAVFWIKRRKDTLHSDGAYLRKSKAYGRFRKSHAALEPNANGQFYAAASNVLRGYLGDKFNVDATALTAKELEEKLPQFSVKKTTVDRVVALIQNCEQAQYGGGGKSTDETQNQTTLKKEIGAIVKVVEKEC